MDNLNKLCCICVCNKNYLQYLSRKDNNDITYYVKLVSSIPEMRFNEINEQRKICEECCYNINITYEFRQKCLRSKSKLIDYILQLPSVSNLNNKINIHAANTKQDKDVISVKTEYEDNIEENKYIPSVNLLGIEHYDIKLERDENIIYEDESQERNIEEVNDDSLVSLEEMPIKISYDDVSQDVSGNELNYEVENEEIIDDPLAILDDDQSSMDHNYIDVEDDEQSEIFTKDETESDVSRDSSEHEEENHIESNEAKTIKLLECGVCRKQFNQLSNLKRHMINHSGQESYKCNICNKIINTLSVFRCHIETHDSDDPTKCNICETKFEDRNLLIEHMRNHYGETSVEYERCSICSSFYACEHLQTNRKQKPYKCQECDIEFIYTSTYNRHIETHKLNKNIEFIQRKSKKLYGCKICHKEFHRADTLKKHLLIHSGESPFECKLCHNKFKQASALHTHMRIHKGLKPYECDICNRKFTQLHTHVTHMRTHTGERPYECSYCNKKFARSNTLTKHVRTHTKETPYECSLCDRKFPYKTSLTRHMSKHPDNENN